MNRLRISFQVLFLSDILGASGHLLDKKYLRRRKIGDKWSTYNFPKENPPNRDINLWQIALWRLVPVGGRNGALGQVIGEGHKIWAWRTDTAHDRLLHFKPSGGDVYTQARHQRRRNRWKRTEADQVIEKCGDIYTTVTTRNSMQIVSMSPVSDVIFPRR